MEFKMKLAGVVVHVRTLYAQTYYMCRAYMVDDGVPADLDICIEDKDIAFELKKAMEDSLGVTHHEEYLETLAVYRKIATAMLKKDIFLMHGAVLAVNDAACMITATSGTGKTTLMRQIFKLAPEAFVVNGDKPLLRVAKDEGLVYACGTPWCGKEHLQTNCEVPLRMICILERGDENRMEEISFSEGLPRLLAQTYRPNETGPLMQTLSLLGELKPCVAIYRVTMKRYDDVRDIEDVAAGLVYEKLLSMTDSE